MNVFSLVLVLLDLETRFHSDKNNITNSLPLSLVSNHNTKSNCTSTPTYQPCATQVVLVNLKDLSCFPVSVATLIGEECVSMEKRGEADSEEEMEEDELLPDVNILPDDEVDDME